MKAVTPRLDRVRHLALYAAFHRSGVNRALHGVCMPVILWTGFVLVSTLTWRGAPAWAHPGVPMLAALLLILARIDAVGAVAVGAWLVPGSALAAELARGRPWWLVVSTALALQMAGWWATVALGHERFEPRVDVDGRDEDSNLYFRRGYFVVRGSGRDVRRIDGLVQFIIAPLASTQDALDALGLRRTLSRAVDAERDAILGRLRAGQRPFEA